jgi:DNA-binding MarR family transcriptional regulator
MDLARASLAWSSSAAYIELTPRQIALLGLLCDDPGPHHVRTAAARLRVSKPVIVRAVNTMETLYLVVRAKDPADGRNCLLAATVAGAALRDTMRKLI